MLGCQELLEYVWNTSEYLITSSNVTSNAGVINLHAALQILKKMAGLPEHNFTDFELAVLQFVESQCKKKMEENRALAGIRSELRLWLFNLDSDILRFLVREMTTEMKMSHLIMKTEQLMKVSYEGVLFVEIEKYSQKKTAAMTGTPSFYSDDFYTDRHGYRMCARIYLNGDGVGKSSHLSVFFALKKGLYDNYLSWPFQRRVTFTLLNQAGKDHWSVSFRPDPTSASFQKPVKEINIASGCPMFVPHKVIENPTDGFLRNNTICLRVKVDPPTTESILSC